METLTLVAKKEKYLKVYLTKYAQDLSELQNSDERYHRTSK